MIDTQKDPLAALDSWTPPEERFGKIMGGMPEVPFRPTPSELVKSAQGQSSGFDLLDSWKPPEERVEQPTNPIGDITNPVAPPTEPLSPSGFPVKQIGRFKVEQVPENYGEVGPGKIPGSSLFNQRVAQFAKLVDPAYWANVAKNVPTSAENLYTGMVKPSPGLMDIMRGPESPSVYQYQGTAPVTPTGEAIPETPKVKGVLDMALAIPRFGIAFLKDPVGTFEKDPAGTALMLSPFAGKLFKGIMGKIGVGPITGAEIKVAMRDIPGLPETALRAVDKFPDESLINIPEKGFEAQGVPTQFQPTETPKMTFPKSAKEKASARLAEAQRIWDEQFAPAKVETPAPPAEPSTTIKIYPDGTHEIIVPQKGTVVPEKVAATPAAEVKSIVETPPPPEIKPAPLAEVSPKVISAKIPHPRADTLWNKIRDVGVIDTRKLSSSGYTYKELRDAGFPPDVFSNKGGLGFDELARSVIEGRGGIRGDFENLGANFYNLDYEGELVALAEQESAFRQKNGYSMIDVAKRMKEGQKQEAAALAEKSAQGKLSSRAEKIARDLGIKSNVETAPSTKATKPVGLSTQFVDEQGKPISMEEVLSGKKKPANVEIPEESVRETIAAVTEKRKLKKEGTPSQLPPDTPKEPVATPAEDPIVLRVRQAIDEAAPIRRQQEVLYSKEKSKRLSAALDIGKTTPGEAGFQAQLGALKGELPKVAYEPIRDQFSQADINYLFQKIEDSPKVEGFDKISTKAALSQLFGEEGGGVPQPKQLEHLETVFGPELVKTLLDKRTLFKKMKDMGLEIANIPRAVMSSTDISFGLRQGVVAATRHPLIFWKDFPNQFKYFASEKAFRESGAEIAARPTFDLMKKSKLSLTEIGPNVALREERFQSNLAEKIPIAGRVIRASDRAYTGFANRLRADVFDYLVKRADEQGLDPHGDIKLSTDIAKVVNVMTGRGRLGKLESAAVPLNALLFSPRLAAARLSMLNPAYYIKLEPFARAEALKSLLSFTGTGLTVLGMAKLAGASIGVDPRSADFGKIKIGNTRIDVWGGFQQYARIAAQLITGKLISSTTGKVTTLGEGYKPLTRLDILSRAVESKESPVASFVTGLLKGASSTGQPFKLGTEIANRFTPMVIQDLLDIIKDNPDLIPLSALGMMGVGLQTYGPKNPKDATGKELDRLKLDIDYLSKIGSQDKIPKAEYADLTAKVKAAILKRFNEYTSNPKWSSLTDEQKTKYLETYARQMTTAALNRAKRSPGYIK
jgi:hypothetical protein